MAYTPIVPDDLAPGMAGNATAWQTLVDNDAELYALYGPPIAEAVVAVAVSTPFGTYADVLEWKIPQNEDELDVRVSIRWKVSGGGTATARVSLDDGSGTDTATGSTTSATETSSNIDVTPSNSAGGSTPRTLKVELKTTAGTAEILAVTCHLVPASAATGTLASGFESTHTGWYSSDEPVPSEVAQRMIDNPKRLAEDRPVTLATILDDISAGSSRAAYTTASSGFVAGLALPPDTGLRTYRVAFRVDRDVGVSGNSTTLYLGPYQFSTTGTGWYQTTQDMHGEILPGLKCMVAMAVTGGSGNVYLRSLQIIREPS